MGVFLFSFSSPLVLLFKRKKKSNKKSHTESPPPLPSRHLLGVVLQTGPETFWLIRYLVFRVWLVKLSHEFFCGKEGIAVEVQVWTDRFILGEGRLRGWAVFRGKNLVSQQDPPEGWIILGVLPL